MLRTELATTCTPQNLGVQTDIMIDYLTCRSILWESKYHNNIILYNDYSASSMAQNAP